jgi:hypothetical protein
VVSLQQFDHEGLIHTFYSEQLCLLLELCEAFIWAVFSGAVNSNELILCSRDNAGSSFPVAVFVRASFIIALDCFSTILEGTFKVLEMSALTDLNVLAFLGRFSFYTCIAYCWVLGWVSVQHFEISAGVRRAI